VPRSTSLHAMSPLSPAHHETSKHDSPNELKVKKNKNENIPDSNSNLAMSMTHHNQTK
jgi:cytochrome c-type biogenesis protein CcmH/NrfF